MAARPLLGRQPNRLLQALVEETGVSNAGLARRINLCGAEYGLDLRYDKTSVSRWLRGQQARGLTPQIVAEVLSRKLNREVTVAEIGMADLTARHSPKAGLTFVPPLAGAIDQVCGLWRADAGRPAYAQGSRVGAPRLLASCRDWLAGHADADVSRSAGCRVGAADIETVRVITQDLAAADHRFGSGHIRPMAVHCLNTLVAKLLKGSYSQRTGRRLFACAARLTELAGYMAVDVGRPGLAQRYYIQALRLSQAADDRGYGAYIIARSVCHLAVSSGHERMVVQAARIALQGTPQPATPTLRALLHASEARGHAVTGDLPAYRNAAAQAQEALAQAGAESEPEWAENFDQAYLAGELAHCCLALGRPNLAVREASRALSAHPGSRKRRRAIDLLLLATAQLRAGEVEEACAAATSAVRLSVDLRSSLCSGYMDHFQSLLADSSRVAAAREFEEALMHARTEKRNQEAATSRADA
ncbi:transcriptional regulator [Streptomyces sp. MB22_4]|uniref:transcriptional regulator n=1 Tax=Streptomyces sp. MB22_4 TaxID=3383120 RepID=UPI00399F8F84